MYPYIYIEALDLELPTYGLCALVGALIAIFVILSLRKKTVLSEDNVLDGIIFAILFGMLGAKLLYLVKDPPIFPLTWDDIKEILTTGLVFYGGLIGGLAGLALASLKTKKPFLAFTDTISPAFCFAHACGRMGCLFAGCCYGVEMEGAFCLQMGGTERLAVQLLEAMFLVLLGIFLTVLHQKKKPRRGIVTGLYMILYAIWRFVIEFWRDDDRGFIGALSTSQFIGIFIFAAGIFMLFLGRKFGWPKDYLTAAPAPATPAPEAPSDTPAVDTVSEAAPAPEAPSDAPAADTVSEAAPAPEKSAAAPAPANPPEKEDDAPESLADLFSDITLDETDMPAEKNPQAGE